MSLLKNEGVLAPGYRTSNLKVRLQQCFGDRIRFVRTSVNESEVVLAAAVPSQVLAEAACSTASVCNDDSPFHQYDTSDETDIADEPPTNHASHQTVTELFNSALFLRSIIRSMKNTVPEVPLAVDLSPDKIDAPVPLYNFLVWLIGGCTTDEDSNISIVERAQSSEECHCHVMSVLQDLVHCTTRGRIRTCKHLALPSTVRHLTRSQQVVNLLNRFGHGYSRSRTLEYDTALAEELSRQSTDDCYIPSNIDHRSPFIFCWDNNDLVEETLSGKGTTHCTNGIVIQRKVGDCPAPSSSYPSQERRKNKRRSLHLPPPVDLEYNSGTCCGPPPSVIEESLRLNVSTAQNAAMDINLAWFFLRSSQQYSTLLGRPDDEEQRVPGWSAFNALMHSREPTREGVVLRRFCIGETSC